MELKNMSAFSIEPLYRYKKDCSPLQLLLIQSSLGETDQEGDLGSQGWQFTENVDLVSLQKLKKKKGKCYTMDF